MSGEARAEGPCALTRGTRDKAQGQYAFEVAHLAAGGRLNSYHHILTIQPVATQKNGRCVSTPAVCELSLNNCQEGTRTI